MYVLILIEQGEIVRADKYQSENAWEKAIRTIESAGWIELEIEPGINGLAVYVDA